MGIRYQKDLHRRTKVFEGVISRGTLAALYKLTTDGVFKTLYGEVNRGKEASIFIAGTRDGGFIILKMYRVESANFQNMMPYIHGDERFSYVKKNQRSMIFAWAKKEFSNLQKYCNAGVRVPEPLAFNGNVLAMELIGEGDVPAQTLRQYGPVKDPEALFGKIAKCMALGYQKARLVHADLSEYNILLTKDEEPVIIDCAQAVLTTHPMAEEFLRHDVANIVKYFRKLGVNASESDLLEKVKKAQTPD